MIGKFKKQAMALLLALALLAALIPALAMADEAPVMPDTGTLVIHKYKIEDPSDVISGQTPGVEITDDSLDELDPLPNIGFSATFVSPNADGSYPETAADVLPAQLGTSYSQTTGPTGIATFTDLPKGVYLVKETNSGGYAPIAPFLVQVPMTNATGDGWLETVHVYPKNQTMNPSKKADGVQYDPLDPETTSEIEWTINVPIPTDMSVVTALSITDEIDELLTLNTTKAVSVKTVASRDAATGTTVPAANYTLTREDNVLSVVFNAAGLAYLGERYELNEPYISITFHTDLTDGALGKLIDNQVEYKFTNNLGTTTKEIPENEIPVVYTGAIKITKTDKDGDPLPGAVFKVASSLANAKAGVYLQDHNGDDLVATSDSDGIAILSGISYGQAGDRPDDATKHGTTKFYLVEVQAPAGYNLVHNPIEVEFSYGTETDTNGDTINYFNNGTTALGEAWSVVNTKGFTLPETGAAGIILSTALGVLLLGAVIVVVARRKSKNQGN